MVTTAGVFLVTRAKTILASNLKRIRTARGLSQGELARAIGVTPSQISQWENPDMNNFVGGQSLDRLAAVLKVRISDLLSEDHSAPLSEIKVPKPPAPKLTLADAIRMVNQHRDKIVIKKVSKRNPD